MRKLSKAAVLACVVVALVAAVALVIDVQVGGERKLTSEPINVRVLADKYSVNGRTGTDLDNLLKGYNRGGRPAGADILVLASEGVGYSRVKETITRVKDAGFEKVALSNGADKSR